MGAGYEDQDLVVCQTDGTPLHPYSHVDLDMLAAAARQVAALITPAEESTREFL